MMFQNRPKRVLFAHFGLLIWCLIFMLTMSKSAVLKQPKTVSACFRSYNITEGEIVKRLIRNYTKSLPEIDGPVSVKIEMRIQQVSALNELTRDFEIEILFSQLWYDPAFSFDHLTTCKKNITMETKLLETIWTPNTCLINSKMSKVHASPYDNTMFILYENGSIWVNYRMQIRAPCDLNLRSFPFDSQRCFMKFESYSYNSEEVQLRWLGQDPITLADKNAIELPDFRLIGWSAQNQSRPYPNGNWDELRVTLIFKRRYGFFVLQAYVPTYLTIIVSWVSFSMNSEIKALPARSTVGVSCLLALTFQIGNIFENLPRVSYVKAMDVWMLGCITFVFGTIVELAVVCSLNKYGRKTHRSVPREKSIRPQLHTRNNHIPVWLSQYTNTNATDGEYQFQSNEVTTSFSGQSPVLVSLLQPMITPQQKTPTLPNHWRQHNPEPRKWSRQGRSFWESIRRREIFWCSLFNSDQIDRFSMLLFPCGFTVFNIFYWSYYLSQAYAHEREMIEAHQIKMI